jgi:hypothetical protein
VLDTTEEWAKENRRYWRRDWRGYVEFFMSQITTEPHSTKPYDDLVGWGMQTDVETMLCDADAPSRSLMNRRRSASAGRWPVRCS